MELKIKIRIIKLVKILTLNHIQSLSLKEIKFLNKVEIFQ